MRRQAGGVLAFQQDSSTVHAEKTGDHIEHCLVCRRRLARSARYAIPPRISKPPPSTARTPPKLFDISRTKGIGTVATSVALECVTQATMTVVRPGIPSFRHPVGHGRTRADSRLGPTPRAHWRTPNGKATADQSHHSGPGRSLQPHAQNETQSLQTQVMIKILSIFQTALWLFLMLSILIEV